MSANPAFASTPAIGGALIGNVANANHDGSGTVYTLFTAGAAGDWLRNLYLRGKDTTTAGMLRLFLYDGVNYRPWKEISVQAVVASATVKAWEYSEFIDEYIPTGYSVVVSTEKAEYFYGLLFAGGLD